jgi:hypothetical protein
MWPLSPWARMCCKMVQMPRTHSTAAGNTGIVANHVDVLRRPYDALAARSKCPELAERNIPTSS